MAASIAETNLSPEQKDHLQNLWKAHKRDLIGIKTANEREPAIIAPHTYNFVVRLHYFFVCFLRKAQQETANSEEASESSHRQQQVANDEAALSFVKSVQSSCLRDYAKLALHNVTTTPNTPSSSSSLSSKQQQAATTCRIRLCEGRHVILLHHDEFLTELNQFELKEQAASTEFIRKDSFGAFLYHMPVDALAAIGCALALAMVTRATADESAAVRTTEATTARVSLTMTQAPLLSVSRFVDATQINVRFVHVQPCVQMMHIKTGLVGKFVTVKGHVVKARPKQLRVATADFMCAKCGGTMTHPLEQGRYSVPTTCSSSSTGDKNNKCRSRTFTLLRPTARYINVQDLRLQEAQEESTLQAGRTPRQLEVELTHDLVDVCRPGDIVLVACTVAAINTAVASGKSGKRAQETSTYKLYLKGHSVTSLSESSTNSGSRQQNKRGGGTSSSTNRSIVYTQQQLQSITQLCHADHRYFGLVERRAFPFDLLVRSICPSIIGHNEVKAGILLCLLGGTPPCASSSQGLDRSNTIRYNSHILIVGDPGMGKSQMLLAASQLAARSVYVGGNTSSTTGLTVTMTKDEGIEPGALVLGDRGVVALDELDKMAKSHQDGLLEAMEQQQVSIAKAGVVASLPARCSVIAAANPRHGNYSMNKSVGENLNMARPILSRFDLVFILRDRADKDQDRMVSSNIMNLYRNPGASMGTIPSAAGAQVRERNEGGEKGRLPLSERLAWVTDFQKQPLPAALVRDYIAYAREYCKPKMTPDAAAILKDYFMELRYPADGRRKEDTVPITTRQLEALIRLCQARAKACLRDFVLKEDALDVVELMSKSVEQVHSDDHGGKDPGRSAGGTSNRKMKKAFANELQRVIGTGGQCSIDDIRRIAENVGCGLSEFQSTVEEMRANGILMKKSNGYFQVVL